MYHSEIRISLRTGYRAQALRIARVLHVHLLKITEATPLPSVEELRALLQQRLDEILGAPDNCRLHTTKFADVLTATCVICLTAMPSLMMHVYL